MLAKGGEIAVAPSRELIDGAGEDRVEHGPAARGRALDAVVAAAHLVDHRVRALERLGNEARVLHGEEAPLVGEAVLRPRAQHDIHRLVEALAVLLPRPVIAAALP